LTDEDADYFLSAAKRPREPARMPTRRLPRRSVLLMLLVAGCAGEPEAPAPQTFAPLDFSYLLPLRLNVATLDVRQNFVPSGVPPDLSGQDPIPPVAALRLMAEQRLKPIGTSGRAVFVINDASLVRQDDTIMGTMSVELDVYTSANTRAGFAQATVMRRLTGPVPDLQAALYHFTEQMMDQMNVEFEYQVRRSLSDWLLPTSAVPPPVEQAPLTPGGAPPPPSPGAPSLQPPPETLVPPTPLTPAPSTPPPMPLTPAPSTLPPPTPLPPTD
jgi:hypothetical protein